jgi:hypothetical protein
MPALNLGMPASPHTLLLPLDGGHLAGALVLPATTAETHRGTPKPASFQLA